MKFLKWTDFVRWTITLALLYGTYTETGIFTLIILLGMSLSAELTALYIRINNKLNDTQNEILKTFAGIK